MNNNIYLYIWNLNLFEVLCIFIYFFSFNSLKVVEIVLELYVVINRVGLDIELNVIWLWLLFKISYNWSYIVRKELKLNVIYYLMSGIRNLYV